MKVELRPHQREAIDKMHNGCVLWGGVGTGKTIAALTYAIEREPGKQIVVITTAKKRDSLDWEREAAMLGLRVEDILVSSWNKIANFVDNEDLFFIFDEQRLVGSGAWVKSFYKIAKKNHWILLSGTPGDNWSDYAPMFIANGWYKNITEFRREHAVYSRFTSFPKIERYINEGKLVKFRKRLLVEMPMVRHTTRHLHYIDCGFDTDTLDIVRKRRWNVYTDEPLQNASELYSVMRKVVSTDPSRREALAKLIAKHPKLIVFYNYNYELEILREMCQEISEDIESGSLFSTKSWETQNSGLILPKKENDLWQQSPGLVTGQDLSSPPTSGTSYDRSLNKTKKPSEKNSSEIDESQQMIFPPSRPVSTLDLPNDKSLSNGTETFQWAEWNGHKHQEIPKTDRWVYLVQYQSGSEGWNCIETDTMAFWSLTYSWKQFEQSQGRIDRLNTPFVDLNYHILMTDSLAEKPVMRALKQKKDFQPR